MKEYRGYIRAIRFYSEATNYLVASFESDELENIITITGNMLNVDQYNRYLIRGDFIVHPKYGEQFQVISYQTINVDQGSEIIKYLSSPVFEGVGEVTAQRIVDKLGTDAINTILEDKDCLKGIKGLKAAKAEMIYNIIKNNKENQEAINFFVNHGLSLKTLGLIQANYKEQTIEIIQSNPYQIIEKIEGIGFKTIDEIALKLGFDFDDHNRINAAIVYAVNEACFQSGSTYLTLEQVQRAFLKIVPLQDEEIFNAGLAECINQGSIVQDNEKYYHHVLYDAEKTIAREINRIRVQPALGYQKDELDTAINNQQRKTGIKYARKQIEAIESFLDNSIMILTGGPGTGKTTIVEAIIKIFHQIFPDDKIALVAPTGRAAKRLSDLTGVRATTIHRLLKWELEANRFNVNRENPLDEQVLIVDETSMVDTYLLARLLEAGRYFYKVLLIGDYHQLPSVRPGNVLKDLMAANIKAIELTEIFRQGSGSGIIELSKAINNDQVDNITGQMNFSDVHFYQSRNFEIINNIQTITKKALAEGYQVNDIQVLAPMYKGIAGIDKINLALQEVFNPAEKYKAELKSGKTIFRVGDKVLQLKNRVEDDVYNGDIGILVDIAYKDGYEYLEDTLIVDFDGTFVEYVPSEFNTLSLAYCISIHKAQGNEFKIVIMPVINDYYVMLRRNLLYTGITRAKQCLFILGQSEALNKGLVNVKEDFRQTSLKTWLDSEENIDIYSFLEE